MVSENRRIIMSIGGLAKSEIPLNWHHWAGWVKKYQESGENSFVGSGNLLPCNEEIVKLRRELADIKEERDILKKAVAIFSKVKK